MVDFVEDVKTLLLDVRRMMSINASNELKQQRINELIEEFEDEHVGILYTNEE